eukprot:gene20310-22309_t
MVKTSIFGNMIGYIRQRAKREEKREGHEYLKGKDDRSFSFENEKTNMSPFNDAEFEESSSKLIVEARRILFNQKDKTDLNDSKSQLITMTTIEVNGILTKNTDTDKLEKVKKSVRFDMDNNRLHEYEGEALNTLSQISLDDSEFIANVLDASDLLASDSELSEDDFMHSPSPPKEQIQLASTSNSNQLFTKSLKPHGDDYDDDNFSVDELITEKLMLKREIADLRAEYHAEVIRLSEEYGARRESYLTDLDDLRVGSYNSEEKMESLAREKRNIESMEEDLTKRRKQYLEQEAEIDEYEKFLNRKHESLSDKENDLRILQDELEEFSRLLRKRERDLKAKSARLDREEDERYRRCNHDEKEIDDLREKVKTLHNDVLKARIEIEKKEESCRLFENKLETVETENKRLHTKVKNLESQLLLDKKINEAREGCDYVRRKSILTTSLGNNSPHRILHGLASQNGSRQIPGRSLKLPPLSNGSTISNDSSFFNTSMNRTANNEISTENQEGLHSKDSKSVKSKTCIVM